MEMAHQDAINRILSPYLDDVWLDRRHSMDQLIEMIVNDHHDEYAQFLGFLKLECAGLSFINDKQWGELLNLMQISKLTNHKTLRLGQLLKNKQQIELNSVKIRQLNEEARRIAAIKNLLSDLENAIANCQLDLCNSDKIFQVDSTSNDTLIDQILASQRYIQDFCRVPLNALLVELRAAKPMVENGRNELRSFQTTTSLASQDDWEQYKQRLNKFRSIIEVFESFLGKFSQFEEIIQQINPLLIASSEPTAHQNDKDQPKLSMSGNSINNSLNECKATYSQVLQFNKQLIDALKQLATKQNKSLGAKKTDSSILQLSRLLTTPKNVSGKSQFTASCLKPEFSEGLSEHLQRALECKAKLDATFNLLRLEFGRLYFVNDIELLRIISLDTRLISAQTKETRQLLSKLYNNSISTFIFDQEGASKIIGVENPYGEKILFFDHKQEPVLLHKRVNVYSLEIIRILNACIHKLRKTLRKLLLLASTQNNIDNIDNLAAQINFNLPVQLMLINEHVKFCQLVDQKLEANERSNLSEIEVSYERKLEDLNARFRNEEPIALSQLAHYKHSACISQTIQFLSILSELKTARDSTLNWVWLKQLRYKINLERETCDCLILDMKFEYNFDYLPFQVQLIDNNPNQQQTGGSKMGFKRLIATKMTDRCLLVASHALSYLRLGANPFGPAGSGKTETIKSLGHALGHLVIVHNCDESNDGKSLDRLIWGLAHTGLWGCFDEFNRLSESTLSSVSSNLELVQTSLRQNLRTVQLPGVNEQIMSLDSNAAFFITLNPVDSTKGGGRYGGRRRLPANLRSLFKPISMEQIPMLTIVSESLRILIASSSSSQRANENITSTEFRDVSDKLVEFFGLMNLEPLKLTNCEFDLRLVVAILARYQIISRQNKREAFSMRVQFAMSIYCEILPRLGSNAIRSKFHFSLIDVFQLNHDDNLTADHPLQDVKFADKQQEQQCRNLYSQLETRNGVILLGETGSGKTACWRQLVRVLNFEREKIGYLVLNPRCCKRGELFGIQDNQIMTGKDNSNSRWIDGLFTHCTRFALSKLRSCQEMNQFWLVLDGPLEPDWVETLNSVIDDNQVLTLSSGERLDFALPSANKCIKLILETDDVSFASPATMSRLGLVFHDDGNPVEQLPIRNDVGNIINRRGVMTNLDKILVLIGSEDQASKLLVNSQERYVKYNCHEHSSAQDLASLINDSTNFHSSKLIYLANFDLIQPEDKWQVKSFEELLRFVVDNGQFYNPLKGPWQTQANEFKFVVQCENIDRVNKRLASLFDTFKVNISVDDGSNSLELDDALGGVLIGADKEVISILCSGYSETRLVNAICNGDDTKVKMFNNGRNVRLNLDEMMEKLNSTNAPTDLQAFSTSPKQLYVLTNLHFKLMRQDQRNQLLFALNILATRAFSNIQFVYLSDCLGRFWQSLGQSIELIQYKASSPTPQDLSVKLSSQKSHLNGKKLAWLASKVNELFQAVFIESSDLIRRESINEEFYMLLGSLIERFDRKTLVQRVNLESGLQRLTRFEENIELVRDVCKSRVTELTSKRLQMDQVVRSLDEKVKSSELLELQLREMRQQQEAKSLEIGERQLRIEQELKHVKPLLEKSKRDIEQHLKPEALNEIRTLRAPPKTIKDILDGVFLIMGKTSNLSWQEVKVLLSKATLRSEITSLDLKKIVTQQMVAKLSQLMQDPSKKDSFERTNAQRASKAILPLLDWLLAVYEFGKVQANMLPLNKELKQLEQQQAEIGQSISKSRNDVDSLEKVISSDKEKLQQLRSDYTAMESESNKLSGKIEHALKALQDCADQLRQWRKNLTYIEEMELRNDPMRYALIGSALALCNSNQSEKIVDALELKEAEKDFLPKLQNFMSNETLKVATAKRELNIEDRKFTELIRMRMLIEESQLIPFVNLNDGVTNDEFSQVQEVELLIQQFYSHKSKSEFQLIACNQLSDWSNLLELAIRLNKFVILYLIEDVDRDDCNNITLDVLDKVRSYKRAQAKSEATSKVEMILCGNPKRHSVLVSLGPVVCVNLVAAHRDVDGDKNGDLKDKLVVKFMGYLDTNLSDSVTKLELELKEKRQERAMLESNLIVKLSSSKSQEMQSKSGTSIALDEPLIAMLSELQVKSKQLDADLLELEKKLSLLNEKRNSIYEKLANEAAKFYTEKILPICQLNPSFYKMSLDSYVKLLLAAKNKVAQLDYTNVMRVLDRSLAPNDKIKARQVWPLQPHFATDLNCIIEEQLRGVAKETHSPLMIAVHDANKPSPQAYIDYLLSNKGTQNQHPEAVVYFKLFATSDSEREIGAMSERLRNIIARTAGSTTSNDLGVIIVICIVNAHLASKWINSRLIQELRDACESFEPTKQHVRLFCLLVAEIDPKTGLFDSGLLDRASCLYWHDELSLSLVQRFELYEKTLPISASSEMLRAKMLSKLILFHVICQESSWLGDNNYSFDYEQLARAWQTYEKQELSRDNDKAEGEGEFFCQYVEIILYGSGMATPEDELRLRKLARRSFLGTESDKLLEIFESFRENENDSDLYNQLRMLPE